jgi:putative addiction module component (TIGR02574 family)
MSEPPAQTDESTSRRLLEEALQLPEVDRVHLAAELLASVDGPDELTDAEWLEELRRRADRVRRGESKGRPWSTVRAELLADLNR